VGSCGGTTAGCRLTPRSRSDSRTPNAARRAKHAVEELVEPHQTPAFRMQTDRRGWFEMGHGRRKKGALVLLRITAPGGPGALVKLKIDPGCGVPVVVLPAGLPK